MILKNYFLVLTIVLFISTSINAQIDARMFRYPDVSKTHITFVYAGDIWIVEKSGGLAHRLSSPKGEEMFPRFSPDGDKIAFSGNYDGNTDVYVVPALGGEPNRVTYHPMGDRLVDWLPDGSGVLFASRRESGRQRYNQFYSISEKGGFPTKLIIPYGEYGALSPDGKKIAYMPQSVDNSTWKRYRGGKSSEIWLFDLENITAQNITSDDANDGHPMWSGNNMYFLSDRDKHQRNNIWKYNLDTKQFSQITNFTDFDITFPAIGPEEIVFQAGGKLYLLDLQTEQYQNVSIKIVGDMATLKSRQIEVKERIESFEISPSGKRALFEARGEIFTIPAEHGVILNLTQSPGAAERSAAWSPDGKNIAYWSDVSGEYELMLTSADGSTPAKQVSKFKGGYRYTIYWSPDSKNLAFIDHSRTINIYNIKSGNILKVDSSNWLLHPDLNYFRVNWSGDSQWITYSKWQENGQNAIYIYNLKKEKLYKVTKGYYDDTDPVFDPDGNYLYFLSQRSLSPEYSSLDRTWIYPDATNIVAVPLRKDVASPLEPRNDVEESKPDEEDDNESEKENGKDKKEKEDLKIDLEDFEERLVVLPAKEGNYGNLEAISGKVIYQKYTDSDKNPIVMYDLKEREEENIVDNASGFVISASDKKMLVSQKGSYYIIDVKPKQKLEDKLPADKLMMQLDPQAEWKQLLRDVWRRYRDYFYDPNMHMTDWDAIYLQYSKLLEDAVTRWDVNFVIGELISELNASHAYVGGGNLEESAREGFGLLGIDWEIGDGAYRVARIIKGAPWDSEVRSPLSISGIDVKSGDYILAVNNIKLDPDKEPWAAFQGLGKKTVQLTVNNKPTMKGARKVLVKTLSSETRLRNLEWIESNRQSVSEASGNRIGYVYMPNTGGSGQTELIRQFYGQMPKDGFIIDERFNSGGQLADRFVELLRRPRVHYIAWRYGEEVPQPIHANPGPKVMLINGWSGSGGDALPYTFKGQGVGKLIGMRTAGALIGPAVNHRLVDGKYFTVPENRIYSNDNTWFPEKHNVEPDIKIIDDPAQLAKKIDPQLEAAIQEVLKDLKSNPPKKTGKPSYEDRTAEGMK